MWATILKKKTIIEDLEIAGVNRHRRECFKIAMKVSKIDYPNDADEMSRFFLEYTRQLVGPEIFDHIQKTNVNDVAVEQLFRLFRKYTLGV